MITHGFNADATDWVSSMAERMVDYTSWWGQTASCYQLTVATNSTGAFVVSPSLIRGLPADQSTSGNIIIKLDWSNVAGSVESVPFQIHPAPFATDVIAQAVVPRLLEAGLIPTMQGHALAELPLHFIGHSRGGSLISEIARMLGREGITVDQLTFLDPHPCVANVFPDSLGCPVFDPAPALFANVQFADNYYQLNNELLELDGQSVAGAYNRRLTSLNGGYGSAHSNTHLWYHGTIDLASPASDGLAGITGQDRAVWYAPGETNGAAAGFLHSRIGGGDQSSTNQPLGAGFPAVESGRIGPRLPLAINSRDWPNLSTVRLRNAGFDYSSGVGSALRREGVVHPGSRLDLEVEWIHSAAGSETISYHLDADANPLNGLGQLLTTDLLTQIPGNPGGTQVRSLELTNPTPYGLYWLAAVISGNNRQRIVYADQKIAVLPELRLTLLADGTLRTRGADGYAAAIEEAQDVGTWNLFETVAFPGLQPGTPATTDRPVSLTESRRFFRSRYLGPSSAQ